MKKKDKPLAWEQHSKAVTPPHMRRELVSNRRAYIKLRIIKTCSDLLFPQQVLNKYQKRKKNRFWLPDMIYYRRAGKFLFQKFYQPIQFQLFFHDRKLSPSLTSKVLKDREYNVERIRINNIFDQLSVMPILLYNNLHRQEKMHQIRYSRHSRFSSAHKILMNSIKLISFKQTTLFMTTNLINKIIKGLQVLSSSNATTSIQKILQLRKTCSDYMIEQDKHLFGIQGEEAEREFADNRHQRAIESKHILNYHTYNFKPETTVPISATSRSSESGNGRSLYFQLDAIQKNTLDKRVISMGENIISRFNKVLRALNSSITTINIQRLFPLWKISNNDMFIKQVHNFFSQGEWPDRQFINDLYQSTLENKYILDHHKYSFGPKRPVPYLAENRTVESRSTGHLYFHNFRRLEEDIEEIKKNMIKTEGQLSERLNSLHTATPSSVPEIEKRLDIQNISNRVYKEIEQRIKIERERRGL